MGNLTAALIPAFAAIIGGVVTGIFTLKAQNAARSAEQARWSLEATERNRTRFHETRLNAYTDFLSHAANAMGFGLHQALQSHREETIEGLPTEEGFGGGPPSWHGEFNPDAARQMTRRHDLVTIVAGSPSVRDAASALQDAVIAIAGVPADDPNWNAAMSAIVARITETRQRFVEAARNELAS